MKNFTSPMVLLLLFVTAATAQINFEAQAFKEPTEHPLQDAFRQSRLLDMAMYLGIPIPEKTKYVSKEAAIATKFNKAVGQGKAISTLCRLNIDGGIIAKANSLVKNTETITKINIDRYLQIIRHYEVNSVEGEGTAFVIYWPH